LSNSQLNGGPILGNDERECANLIKKCNEETCKGKEVLKNMCSDPKKPVCECKADNKNTTTPAPGAVGNDVAPAQEVAMGSAALTALLSTLFF
jgi:hypothetical protein